MDWWLACFFLGAIFSLFSPIVPDIFVLFLLILLSILFFYYPFYSNKIIKPLRLSSGVLFGASWMLLNAFNYQQLWHSNNINAVELSSKAQWIQGEISSLHLPLAEEPAQLESNTDSDNRLRFNAKITHLNNNRLNSPMQLRLSWKNPSLALQQGQTVQLKVKFKPAHGLANLGSFSYQTWLNSKKISATGYVVNHKDNKLHFNDITLRQKGFSAYQQLLPDHDLSPLLLALGFGSRIELSQAQWKVLQRTGTGHLIAISGLHIGLVATGVFFTFMLLIRTLPLKIFTYRYNMQTLNSRYFAIGISMLVALGYGYLAGFSLPTVRALVMLSVYWCIRFLGIKISIIRWLLFTLFIITLTTPFSLFTASFWLSFYAVVIIFLTLWRFKRCVSSDNRFWRFLQGLIVIQLSLTLMLLPISALFFQQISIVSLFANIIAVPWMSFISIPLCLLSVLLMPISATLSQVIIMLCLESIELLWFYLTYLSTLSWALLTLSSTHVHLIMLIGIVSLIFVFFQVKHLNKNKVIVVTSFCLLFLLFNVNVAKRSNEKLTDWQLVVFDVGQGLSILVQRNNKAVLYDTGASYRTGFNMVDAVILPYLQHAGIQQLDKVIISHGDNDHAGGLVTLQNSIDIKELIYNDAKSTLNSICLQGHSFDWQNISFEMLWPNKPIAEDNDDSCVVLISDNNHKVLLTGDISKKVESKLIQQYPDLQVDVLIVPHHGSKTSSSEMFITHVDPDLAIVSAGYLNRWNMPVIEVTNRYKLKNIALLNSASSGQIILDLSESGIEQYTYRSNLWPFWFASPLRQ